MENAGAVRRREAMMPNRIIASGATASGRDARNELAAFNGFFGQACNQRVISM